MLRSARKNILRTSKQLKMGVAHPKWPQNILATILRTYLNLILEVPKSWFPVRYRGLSPLPRTTPYSLFDPDWPNSREIQQKWEKIWKNDQFWTFLKIKNDSDTFRVSSWYFCKALVAGYPSTTYGMVPWRLRRKLSSLFHQTENQKLTKIKENRYILLNFS